MRAGLSTIQQTLTPEAARVLHLSIAEADRRHHGQTTPLHVASTLLQSPTGLLRQACTRSHPNSSHPLQCRALELCFTVALERLPTSSATTSAVGEPPLSNALTAALKRAQAHQRRGCPEQQQQPILAVKVELEQLIISILDDPSVSRVMREASFSSPAVKAAIEQSLNSANPPPQIGTGFRPNPITAALQNRNWYLNPRLQQGNSNQSGEKCDDVKRVTDILSRTKKRNPVLVGESELDSVVREVFRRIEKGGLGEGPLKNVEVIKMEEEICLDKALIPNKIKELGGLIEAQMGKSSGCGGVILDLGDLKWLVGFGVAGSGVVAPTEAGRAAVAEMAELLARFGEGGRLWLIGTATCETYLRCQVYHPSMEHDWDLQTVSFASKLPFPEMFPRLGANGIHSSSAEPRIQLKNFPNVTPALPKPVCQNLDPARRMSCCPQCTESYEQELAKLVVKESEKSSLEPKPEAARPTLPQWLQNAKLLNNGTKAMDQSENKDQEMMSKQKSQELQKKWSDTCLQLHPNFHRSLESEKIAPLTLPVMGLYNPKLLLRQPIQPKVQLARTLGETLQLGSNPVAKRPLEQAISPPRSPVRTDLALGLTKTTEATPEKTHKDSITSPVFSEMLVQKLANAEDIDLFKKLLKGLKAKVWWQQEAASVVATTVTQCRLGNGKKRGTGSKGDIWLLFTGPDRVGKKKMATVLADQICGTTLATICLGKRRDDEEVEVNFRGKTALDRIVEAVRRNPFSVIFLEDIDEADLLVRGSIKQAMERGRLADSHGREINLGNVIFILTANCLPENVKTSGTLQVLDETRLASVVTGGWQLRLSIAEKRAKRRANWAHDEERPTKPRKEMGFGLSLDLNLAADTEDDRIDGSYNCSDHTVDHEDDHGLGNMPSLITSVPHELLHFIDNAIFFKPVEISPIYREIKSRITEMFSSVVDKKHSLEFEEEALEKILGGVWLGRTGLDEWAEKVLVPSFQQLKTRLATSDETVVVRLESECEPAGDLLPSKITVNVEGV
ncbi:protein SUPPRESSOR OF MAX2 1-like [Actinidia eriantha]|uniref:protein SUPPRESSOR OF MAX2 1-like n=1 Tax=Actinidia eriantha TaxID=165200 RepID=UPI00258EA296|nr:protein SUPPRESSOR OF MAX2 1-like [Actinidia eriantha]